MNFDIPEDLRAYLQSINSFIDSKISTLQHFDDNNRFFDHRREHARTNWDQDGNPRPEWEELLKNAQLLAGEAGFFRFALPKQYGGEGHPETNLWMSAIRYHLSSHPVYGGGLGLANDLQNEHSIVGNFPDILMIHHFGSEEQRRNLIPARLSGKFRMTFGLTEPDHGSDATFMSTVARHDRGITALLIPRETPGVQIQSYEWTLNMPTDHATVEFNRVWVPESAVLGSIDQGLALAQTFVHENRIRQAASSCGAARFCLDRSIERSRSRKIWGEGKSLADNQAIQFPVVELMTQVEMLWLLILKTSWEMDRVMTSRQSAEKQEPPWVAIERQLGDKVAMCNFWANRLCCQAADQAIQIHGGDGYSRHYPFEHIYRHFRRYRITEGAEEIQMRKIAAYIFGFTGPKRQLAEKNKVKL